MRLVTTRRPRSVYRLRARLTNANAKLRRRTTSRRRYQRKDAFHELINVNFIVIAGRHCIELLPIDGTVFELMKAFRKNAGKQSFLPIAVLKLSDEFSPPGSIPPGGGAGAGGGGGRAGRDHPVVLTARTMRGRIFVFFFFSRVPRAGLHRYTRRGWLVRF